MSKQPNTEADSHEAPRPKSTAVLLLGDIANITWRMFVPTIGLLLLGRWIDNWLGISPVALLIGLSLGIIISTWLVTKQIKEVS